MTDMTIILCGAVHHVDIAECRNEWAWRLTTPTWTHIYGVVGAATRREAHAAIQESAQRQFDAHQNDRIKNASPAAIRRLSMAIKGVA